MLYFMLYLSFINIHESRRVVCCPLTFLSLYSSLYFPLCAELETDSEKKMSYVEIINAAMELNEQSTEESIKRVFAFLDKTHAGTAAEYTCVYVYSHCSRMMRIFACVCLCMCILFFLSLSVCLFYLFVIYIQSIIMHL